MRYRVNDEIINWLQDYIDLFTFRIVKNIKKFSILDKIKLENNWFELKEYVKADDLKVFDLDYVDSKLRIVFRLLCKYMNVNEALEFSSVLDKKFVEFNIVSKDKKIL